MPDVGVSRQTDDAGRVLDKLKPQSIRIFVLTYVAAEGLAELAIKLELGAIRQGRGATM